MAQVRLYPYFSNIFKLAYNVMGLIMEFHIYFILIHFPFSLPSLILPVPPYLADLSPSPKISSLQISCCMPNWEVHHWRRVCVHIIHANIETGLPSALWERVLLMHICLPEQSLCTKLCILILTWPLSIFSSYTEGEYRIYFCFVLIFSFRTTKKFLHNNQVLVWKHLI